MPIPDEDVSSTLRTILARELKRAPETLAPEANLAELGLSSVKVLRAVAEVERRFGIELPDERVFACATLADLVRVVQERVTA